ncbi:EcsC family protein [Cellulophaga baltica]|uniref:EcsC family protein n=1 Tax=Cellulophaga TaxID=104264 RepID=UPI001C06EFEC|nr:MULTISPECIES: EcsC family protein [Cellulophaga]MBU2997619.1 EcsC family protein [Cellulophaga baltica]MDO6769014.1 EcsC family protein [Cellulophaga sp. 1_MG-2023]
MFNTKSKKEISEEDLLILTQAKQQMDDIGWAMKGLNKVGNVIQNKIDLLPEKQLNKLQKISYDILLKVVNANLLSMKADKITNQPINNAYKAMVTTSGVLGGTFGMIAFTADLTLTTKIMMRSIMDIARSQGEDITDLDTQLACLQVFALGGKSKHDDNLDTGYYATRITLNSTMKGATAGAGKITSTLLKSSSNPIIQVLGAIASRFSVQVSEKFVAQAIPILGAAGGGAINLAFMNHFQSMAQAHFSIRRLERKYDEKTVKKVFDKIVLY